jgi:hypothetical protein
MRRDPRGVLEMAEFPAPNEGIVLTHFIVSGDVVDASSRSGRCTWLQRATLGQSWGVALAGRVGLEPLLLRRNGRGGRLRKRPQGGEHCSSL